MGGVVLDVKHLNLYFNTNAKKYQVLFDINFTLHQGEFMGIIGESGSGKTQTAMSILNLSPKNSSKDGEIIFRDRDLLNMDEKDLNKIRGNYISIALQDSSQSLNPFMNIGSQLIEPLVLHYGKSTKDAKKEVVEILDNLKIRDAKNILNKYPYEFSGGQRQRFLIAMALSCNPTVFIADELTTSLDVETKICVLQYLKELKEKNNMAILFISHDIKMISNFADKVVVMYCGHILEEAENKEFFSNIKHPYSKGLIDLIPKIEDKGRRLRTIDGEIPQLNDLPKGCPFCSRCKCCLERCKFEKPELKDYNGHKVSCFVE